MSLIEHSLRIILILLRCAAFFVRVLILNKKKKNLKLQEHKNVIRHHAVSLVTYHYKFMTSLFYIFA